MDFGVFVNYGLKGRLIREKGFSSDMVRLKQGEYSKVSTIMEELLL